MSNSVELKTKELGAGLVETRPDSFRMHFNKQEFNIISCILIAHDN